MLNERLKKQIEFIVEIDKIKQVFRQNMLIDGSRHENDAEHSWHLAMMAFLLAEYANTDNLDVARVMKMVLIHDLVEIDAGDTFCYDEIGALDKGERETKAADRLFNMLPSDQAEEFRVLWEEFEAMDTPEAQFAAALDRFQPLLQNYHTTGATTWARHSITSDKVYQRNQHIKNGAPELWKYACEVIEDCIAKGLLRG